MKNKHLLAATIVGIVAGIFLLWLAMFLVDRALHSPPRNSLQIILPYETGQMREPNR
jgi:hypothetical protein